FAMHSHRLPARVADGSMGNVRPPGHSPLMFAALTMGHHFSISSNRARRESSTCYTSCLNAELNHRHPAPPLLGDLDIRLADDLGVFLGVCRIEFSNLVGIHRLYRLQGLLLQRL